jgi:hypothetical protein
MQLVDGELLLSASDLIDFLECEHLTWLGGIFLDHTRRMHPDVCDFVSHAVYQGRLSAIDECTTQSIECDGPLSGTGVRAILLDHDGNTHQSPEEAERIAIESRWPPRRARRSRATSNPLLPQPPQRGNLAREVHRRARLQPQAADDPLPHRRTDATGERALPAGGDGGRRGQPDVGAGMVTGGEPGGVNTLIDFASMSSASCACVTASFTFCPASTIEPAVNSNTIVTWNFISPPCSPAASLAGYCGQSTHRFRGGALLAR